MESLPAPLAPRYSLAVSDFDEVTLWAAGIQLPRTTNFVVAGDHFAPMRDPTRGAARSEDYRKHFYGYANGLQDDA